MTKLIYLFIGLFFFVACNAAENNQTTSRKYIWRYKNTVYCVKLNLKDSLYESYKKSQKQLLVKDNEKIDWGNFYGLFLVTKEGDNTIEQLAKEFRSLQKENNLNDNQLAELVVSFVQQSITYDGQKAANRRHASTDRKYLNRHPYETLYDKLGVCSEKSFLGYLILKQLGFGVALLESDAMNHLALGIASKDNSSCEFNNYYLIETTNESLAIGALNDDLRLNKKSFVMYKKTFGQKKYSKA